MLQLMVEKQFRMENVRIRENTKEKWLWVIIMQYI